VFYRAELQYLQKMLQKLQLAYVFEDADSKELQPMDVGMRAFGLYAGKHHLLQNICHWAKSNIIYKLTDDFLCTYIFFMLPEIKKPTAMIIGPYLSSEMSSQHIIKKAEELAVPHEKSGEFERYYRSIPVIKNDNLLFIILNSFGETVWGEGGAYSIQDISREYAEERQPFARGQESTGEEDHVLNIHLMEQRYAYENRLLDLVSHGWGHKAELMVRNFPQGILESRAANPARNAKNYAIVFNTLLRKAAERGGVHPIYLDRLSSELARTIERTADWENFPKLLQKMVRRYSELVQNIPQGISPIIQRVIANIDMDPAGNQSLRAHAERLNISAGYLSALFHRETGTTLTDFVNRRRMEYAAYLLRTTRQSVSSIAQNCGMQDDNYFGKLFKKYMGLSPCRYREAHHVEKHIYSG